MKNFLGKFAFNRFLNPKVALAAVATFLVAGAAYASDAPLPLGDFFTQVAAFYAQWGGLENMAKISGIITLIVGSFKVDAIKHVLWDKPWFEKLRPWSGPVLGILAGLLQNGNLTLGSTLAYLSAGVGAAYLFKLLDLIKIPAASNSLVMAIIGIIQTVISKGESGAQPK